MTWHTDSTYLGIQRTRHDFKHSYDCRQVLFDLYCFNNSPFSLIFDSNLKYPTMGSLPPHQSHGRLAGKVAIVTGGASGFGLATTILFAAEGARVVVADLNEQGGKKVAARDPENIVFQKANVATQQSWQDLVQTAESTFGHVDIVVNNAGTSYANKPTLDVTEEEYDMTMDVNCKSIFWSVKEVVPAMIKTGRGGAFVNVASIGATRPRPGLVWYAASKGTVANVSNFNSSNATRS